MCIINVNVLRGRSYESYLTQILSCEIFIPHNLRYIILYYSFPGKCPLPDNRPDDYFSHTNGKDSCNLVWQKAMHTKIRINHTQ